MREFITAFTAEWNRLAAERNAERAQDKTRLATIQRKIDRIVEAITEGFRTPEMKDQLEALSQQKAQLQARLTSPATPAPSLHPNLAELYREKVASLQSELTKTNGSNSAVLEAMRDLIERVDFGPGADNGEPDIILAGAISSMVRLGLPNTPTKTTPSTGIAEGVPDLFMSSVKVVAGARFERATFRL